MDSASRGLREEGVVEEVAERKSRSEFYLYRKVMSQQRAIEDQRESFRGMKRGPPQFLYALFQRIKRERRENNSSP